MVQGERPLIEIELVFANAPHQIERETLLLPVGVTVSEACAASALATRLGFGSAVDRDGGAHAPLGLGLGLGLWGGLCGPDTVLQPHDRLTLLRPLQADPMEARRQRLRRDGMRKAKPPPRGVRGP